MERSAGPIRRDPIANLGLCSSCCAHMYVYVYVHARTHDTHADDNKMAARVGGEIENGGGE